MKKNFEEINDGTMKVGSIYILTEENYAKLKSYESIVKDLAGTIKKVIKDFDPFLKVLENN